MYIYNHLKQEKGTIFLKKITTKFIKACKNSEKFNKISVLTAYDFFSAKLLDECEIDIILVGDSLGNVILGYDDTTKVTMEDMLHHTSAVSRGVKRALIVADMPFLSYHLGEYKAIENAGKLISQGGANAVKLEGGSEVAETVQSIVNAGIPVMGHIGLTPQSVNQLGGYGVQGKTEAQANKLIEDAKKLEACGAFAIVLECIPSELAEKITKSITIPTIGIGAGANCDGQVLVTHDMLGICGGYVPSFVKKYANLDVNIKEAITQYINEVKSGEFPE